MFENKLLRKIAEPKKEEVVSSFVNYKRRNLIGCTSHIVLLRQ
jgi:hypothetical protein